MWEERLHAFFFPLLRAKNVRRNGAPGGNENPDGAPYLARAFFTRVRCGKKDSMHSSSHFCAQRTCAEMGHPAGTRILMVPHIWPARSLRGSDVGRKTPCILLPTSARKERAQKW